MKLKIVVRLLCNHSVPPVNSCMLKGLKISFCILEMLVFTYLVRFDLIRVYLVCGESTHHTNSGINMFFKHRHAQGCVVSRMGQTHLVHATDVVRVDILLVNAPVHSRAQGHVASRMVQGHLVHATSVVKPDILFVNVRVQLRCAFHWHLLLAY